MTLENEKQIHFNGCELLGPLSGRPLNDVAFYAEYYNEDQGRLMEERVPSGPDGGMGRLWYDHQTKWFSVT